jgi:type I restriction-modification system DNA methylase subunit
MCEDRGIESHGQIQSLLNGTNTYHRLRELFYHADGKYNSGLFDFKTDRLTPELKIDDHPLKDIFRNLYYPDSPYEFSVLGADILGHVYEQFLGKVIRLTGGHQAKVEEKPEVRKAGGVYYTPTYIVDYIVKNTVGKLCEGKRPRQISSLRILDPACGSGSFLLGAYQYLLDYHRDWYQKDGSGKHTKEIYQGRGGQWYLTIQEKKRVLLNNIYGVDIDPQAVEVTKLSLLLKVLEGENQDSLEKQMKLFKERALPNLESNIKWGNSLIGPESSQGIQLNLLDPDEIYRINRFDWEKEFPQIMKQGGFDAVIGNPPYIRIQTLKDSAPLEIEFYKDYYSAASKGNYDIYVVFIERGLSLLNQEGSLGFIVPHKFFTAKYGEPIRNLVAKGMYLVEVVHFGDRQIFTGASTYTCLLFLNKTGSKECKIRRVDDLNGWRNTGEADEGSIPANKISASEWTFAIGRASGLMDKMDRLPLKLGDIANRIFQGPITSADRVFLFKEFRSEKTKRVTRVLSQELNDWVELESAILKPVIRSGSIGRYYANPTALVLFPYEVKDCSAELYIPSELNQEYPLAWKYLNRNKKMLESREQGRFKDSHWYCFGRTQNLGMWEQPKLMIPYMITHLAAYLDKGDNFYFINVTTGGYGITISGSPLGLEYLCGLINSRVLDFYLKQVSTTFHGGYFAANKQYIERLPIRSIDFNKSEDAIIHQSVVELVETMLTLHRRLGVVATVPEKTIIQRQLAESEERINNLVFKLYGLTDGEIKTINKEAG